MKRRRPSLLLLVFVAIFQVSVRGQKIDLDKDIELEVSAEVVNSKLVSYLNPFLGRSTSSSSSSQRTSLIVDLTYDRVMIANKKGSSYGIDCTSDLYCEISGYKDVCTYQEVPVYDCQQGSVLVKFKEAKVIDPNIAQMTTFFYNSSVFWENRLGKYGVFGLSPNSPIWTYFEAAYNKQPGQEYIETSLSYGVKDVKNAIDPSRVELSDSYLTVNGRAGINDPVVQTFSRIKYPTLWVYDGATIAYSSKNTKKNVSVCVDNTQQAYFLSNNASEITKSILMKLCGRNDSCNRSESNLNNLEVMSIAFSGLNDKKFTMSIKPEEYVNFDGQDKAIIGIQDLSSSKCSEAIGVSNAIGRLMLTKIEFVVRVIKSQTNESISLQMGFNEISYPKDTVFLIILIVLGVIILLIIAGIMIASSLAKKKATDDDSEKYHKAEEVDN